MEKIVEIIMARGHPLITARHPTTLMITKERAIGAKGDCIIAVAANKGAADLSVDFKKAIESSAKVTMTIEVSDDVEKVSALGHPSLTLEHPFDLVVRKSKFICGRTLAIGADKASSDLPREFVNKLRTSDLVKIIIEASLH